MKFKVGDRVRTIRDLTFGETVLKEGNKGTVKIVGGGMIAYYIIAFDNFKEVFVIEKELDRI
ncbi:hypothetical protein KZP23_15815 [Echinicola marina]|uniref:hypothetical protein n=1 Tax=Echinicola marina TaxID=2859768 RepID=UPI001CF6B28D|nr:hypothetical protein [Echinicola marina]UCS92167.1 hypothetical protein KZP23_15815 [Echinicola marina]